MARILHTSDWHVGRGLHRADRSADHAAVLAEVVAVASDAAPDVIVHTGDVFDGPRPAVESLHLALDTLRQLGQIAPTLVLAGNHDSPALFDVFTMLLGPDSRVRFIARARPPQAGGIVDVPCESGERVRIAPVPFVHANRAVPMFESPSEGETRFADPQRAMGTYAQRIGAINAALNGGLVDGYDGQRDVLVYAAHCYVTGAHLSESERPLHVTDAYAAQVDGLPQVSYAALGHIHKPQALPGGRSGRYAGSLLQLDFGEEADEKVTVIVDAAPGRPARIDTTPITAGRRLRTLRGTIEQIEGLADHVGDALCRVTVECDDPIDGLNERIAALLPDATVVDLQEFAASRHLEALDPEQADLEAERDVAALMGDYLSVVGTTQAPAARVAELFGVLQSARADDAPPDLGLADALTAAAAEELAPSAEAVRP